MRLLVTTDTLGGVWDYTAALTHVLAAEGHAVLLAILGEPTDAQLSSLSEEIAIESRRFRLEWMPDSAEDVLLAKRWLMALARAWRPDLIHLNQMAYTVGSPFAVPTVVVVHSDVVSWFSEVRNSAPPAHWREYVRVTRAGLAGADHVVTPTRYQADLVERHFGIRPDRVIPNGLSSAPLVCDLDRELLILSAARAWDEGKGMATLDEALGLLGRAAPPGHLLGATRGPGGESFRANHLRWEGSVSRDAVNQWMSRASIFVAPSLYEPFGLSPLEAAAHGCALILSDIGSFRELWDGCALFFTPGDATSLAGAIQELSTDARRLTRLAEAARERAVSRYSIGEFGAAYLELYRELARFPANCEAVGTGAAAGTVESA
jgi:glycogen synthase